MSSQHAAAALFADSAEEGLLKLMLFQHWMATCCCLVQSAGLMSAAAGAGVQVMALVSGSCRAVQAAGSCEVPLNPYARLIPFADDAEDSSSMDKLLSKQGFWKKVLASKAAPVRGAAYVLVAHTAQQ